MTRNECQKNRDTLTNLYLIRSLLESSELINTSSKANIQTQANTQVNKRSSDNAASPIVNVEDTSAMIGETATSNQVVNEEDNNQSKNPGLESAVSKNGNDQLPADNLEQNSKGVDDSSIPVQSIGMVISQSNSASTITLGDDKPLMKDIENDNDPSEEDQE